MVASEIFRISEAREWRRFSRLSNCNTSALMLTILQHSNRYEPLPSKTAYTSATLYKVTITMDRRLRDITLDSNRYNHRSICKLLLEETTHLWYSHHVREITTQSLMALLRQALQVMAKLNLWVTWQVSSKTLWVEGHLTWQPRCLIS